MARRRRTALPRWLRQAGWVVLGAVLLAYPLDWGVWQLRMVAGHGMGSVDVTQETAATLKGNRFEIYAEQQTTVNCSRSLLPEAGAGPCWWLRRHSESVTQY